jgi:hypothetical protein
MRWRYFIKLTSGIHKNSRAFTRTREVTLDINPYRIRRGAALLILAMALACRRSYPLGKLSVQTVDANYAPVRGVAADLFKVTPSGHVYWRASRTGGNGFAVFGENNGGVIEGDYVVRVSLMAGQTLAPGESNDRAVKLRAGDNTVVTFRVVPWKPVRPTLRYTP